MLTHEVPDLLNKIVTVDFETQAIQPRPVYPPEPAGVAIRWPGGRSEYLAWSHPAGAGNNCTMAEAYRALVAAWRSPVLCHNAKFDLEVAWKYFGLPFPDQWHDTMYAMFLHEPHAPTYALKPSAKRLLAQEPEERDAVREWILANVPGSTKKNFGAFIALAPVNLVGPYAIGDVQRTFDIFRHLIPSVVDQWSAYDRERRLMPWFLDAELRGIPAHRDKLRHWEGDLRVAMEQSEFRIFAMLGCSFNLDSSDELADVLEATYKVDPARWERTEGGARSVAKDALLRTCNDVELAVLLNYRNTAGTFLNTFVCPWLAASSQDGRLHTSWNSTRSDGRGTRTGRPSSSNPNLANVPNASEILIPPGLAPLPSLRDALLPEEGHRWIKADYSQQELRMAAHYAEGGMARSYRANPRFDLHQWAADMVSSLGVPLTRRRAKTTGFAIIYGAGLKTLSEQLGCTRDEADAIRTAYFLALPELKGLIARVKDAAAEDGFVRSLGGRRLSVQPSAPTEFDVQVIEINPFVPSANKIETVTIKVPGRDLSYKLPNMLIQGSAADQTKEAIIRFNGIMGSAALTMVTNYDDISISTADPDAKRVLVDCMVNALPLDVPVCVDVTEGASWGEAS